MIEDDKKNISMWGMPKADDMDDIKQWLESLPQANPARAILLIHNALLNLQTQTLSPETRWQCLALFQPVMAEMSDRLHQHYFRFATMPYQARRQGIKKLQVQESSLVQAYCQLIFDEKPLDDDTQHAIAIHRTFFHLQRIFLHSRQFHIDVPSSFWLQAYRLYQHARDNGLDKFKIAIDPQHPEQRCSINTRFKSLLLASLANLHQLRAVEIEWLAKQLPEWSNYLMIHDGIEGDDLFIFSLTVDQPPVYKQLEQHADLKNYLALDMFLLAEYLQNADAEKQVDDTLSPSQIQRCFDQCRSIWSAFPKRSTPRLAEQGELSGCLGLAAFYYFLTPQDTQMKAPYHMHTWTLSNRSKSGYCLMLPATEKVEAGDLLGLRDGDGAWEVGVIRWLRGCDDNTIQVGIEVVSQNVSPIVIQRREQHERHTDFLKALRVEHEHEHCIILPNLKFEAGAEFRMVDESLDDDIQLITAIQSNERHAIFSYKLLNEMCLSINKAS